MNKKLLATASLVIALNPEKLFAEERIDIMKIINDTPKCYVLTEILNMYSTGTENYLDQIFLNYSNASRVLLGDKVMKNNISLMFNKKSAEMRKIVVTDIAESGLKLKNYREIYDEFSCSSYTTIIEPEHLDLETSFQ